MSIKIMTLAHLLVKNTVINEQDNSIRQYGGDNRSFTYNGSGNNTDTPASRHTVVSMQMTALLPSWFDSTTMNRDNQNGMQVKKTF